MSLPSYCNSNPSFPHPVYREMDSINDFVKARVSKPWGIRAVYNVFDAKKIIEYRQRLNSAVQNFQVRIEQPCNMNYVLIMMEDFIRSERKRDVTPTGEETGPKS